MILPLSKLALQPVAPVINLDDLKLSAEERQGRSDAGLVLHSAWEKSNYLSIQAGEPLTIQLSPFTPQHLATRRLAFHYGLGQRGQITHPMRGSKFDVTTCFGAQRLLCPLYSGPAITRETRCPVCALLETWAGDPNEADWQQHFRHLLSPRLSYEVEAVPIGDKRAGAGFLRLTEREAWAAFSRCTDDEFTRPWTVTRTESGIVLRPAQTKPSRRRFGSILYVRETEYEDAAEFTSMVLNSEGKMPTFSLGPGRADRLRELLGEEVQFVPCYWGSKQPIASGWNDGAAEQWNAQWDVYAPILDGCNIAFRCGAPSGNLCSFDFDDAAQVEPWLKRNPWAADVLRVISRRGCSFLFRVAGEYPRTVIAIKSTVNEVVHNVGELRLAQLQTVDGLHASGTVLYRMEGTEIPTVTWARLVSGWPLLWDEYEPPRKRRTIFYESSGRGHQVDLTKLVNARQLKDCIAAQCPVCARGEKDTRKDNLHVYPHGIKCIVNHSREEILELIGVKGWNEDDEDDYEQEPIIWKRSTAAAT